MKNYLENPKITAYALGELQGSEAEEIKKLIEQDENLKAHVASIQATASSLSAVFKQEDLVPLKGELREKLHRVSSPKRSFNRSWVLACSGVAVAGLAFIIITKSSQEEVPKAMPVAVVQDYPAPPLQGMHPPRT